MEVLLYISVGIFVTYIVAIISVYGVPDSISESYYLLSANGGRKKNVMLASFFTFFCWGVGFTLLIYWIDVLPNDLNILIFLAAAALCFVGASPMFKANFERTIHFASAYTCFAAGYAWMFHYGRAWLFGLSIAGLALVLLMPKQKRMFWWEVVGILTLYVELIIEKLGKPAVSLATVVAELFKAG